MKTVDDIKQAIMMDSANQKFTQKGIEPLFASPTNARIVIVGQAPGIRAQEQRLYWDDPSGDQLREWLGVDRTFFYETDKFAVLPMDFYFPGKAKTGDLPPRKNFAEKWHPLLMNLMPQKRLVLLIGQYAQHYYLKQSCTAKVTETVKKYQNYLPDYFPLVHPSPRNNIWQARNPWFKADVIPTLQQLIQTILNED